MSGRSGTLECTEGTAGGSDVQEGAPSLLDAILATAPASAPRPAGPYVGDVIQGRSAASPDRVRVRWREVDGEVREAPLLTLASLPVRPADRVLLAIPVGWDEPIVTGVIDGASSRPPAEPRPKASIAIERDESVRVAAADGTPLVEIFQAESGPVVRLCTRDAHVELPGRLRIDARSIELCARQGGVAVKATDAVVLEGETIRLN